MATTSRWPGTIVKGSILILALVVVIAASYWFSKHGIPQRASALFSGNALTVAGIDTMASQENIRLKKIMAGLWERSVPRAMPKKPYSTVDRIEIKDNGIFWQVKHLTIWFPDGDSASCMNVITGYLNPYQQAAADTSEIPVDAIVRAQVVANASDTCYISNIEKTIEGQRGIVSMAQEQYAARLKRNGSILRIDEQQYEIFDTITNKLSDFFPLGSVELVDKISVKECRNAARLVGFAREQLKRRFSKVQAAPDGSDVAAAIENYYFPLVLSEIAKQYTVGVLKPLKGEIPSEITIGSDGKVASVKVESYKLKNRYFKEAFVNEVSSWAFAAASDSKPRTVRYTFKFN